jgi:hypothetical protein
MGSQIQFFFAMKCINRFMANELDNYAIEIDIGSHDERCQEDAIHIGGGLSGIPSSDEDEIFDFKLHNLYIQSNSPISMSENNSDNDNDNDNDNERSKSLKYDIDNDIDLDYDADGGKKRYDSSSKERLRRRLGRRYHEYEDIERALNNDYEKDSYKYSRQLEILILFIKGQKNVYFQSKNLTQAKLFLFMIPTLLITIAVTIFAPIVENYKWSGGVISGLNFLVTSLISVMNFMKLESKTECYNQIASQYDKIETALEIMSSKLFFIKTEEEKKEMVLTKILETEARLNELKDINPVIIPNEIKILFPIISHTNIFSLIKKIENQKRDLIFQLMHTKNEIHYILNKWKRSKETMETTTIERNREKNRLFYLYEIKTKIKDDIIKCNQIFQKVETDFFNEICSTEKISPLWILFCCCFASRSVDSIYSSSHIST